MIITGKDTVRYMVRIIDKGKVKGMVIITVRMHLSVW